MNPGAPSKRAPFDFVQSLPVDISQQPSAAPTDFVKVSKIMADAIYILLVKVIVALFNDCKVLEVKHKCEQEKHKVRTAMR
jgi:hypothetical protein